MEFTRYMPAIKQAALEYINNMLTYGQTELWEHNYDEEMEREFAERYGAEILTETA